MATTKRKPGSGSSLEQFQQRLAGMDTARIKRMSEAATKIMYAFDGDWSRTPNLTLKEFVGAVEDEIDARRIDRMIETGKVDTTEDRVDRLIKKAARNEV